MSITEQGATTHTVITATVLTHDVDPERLAAAVRDAIASVPGAVLVESAAALDVDTLADNIGAPYGTVAVLDVET